MRKQMIVFFPLIFGLLCVGCKVTSYFAQFSVDGYPITYQDPNKTYEIPTQYNINSYTVLPYIKSTSSDDTNNDYTFWIEVFTQEEYDDIDSRIVIEKYTLTDEDGNTISEGEGNINEEWSHDTEYGTYRQKCFVINNEVLQVQDGAVYYLYIQTIIDDERYFLEYAIDTYIPRGIVFPT